MDTEFTITGSWLRRGDDLYTLIYSKAGEAVADFVEKNLDNAKLNTSPYDLEGGARYHSISSLSIPSDFVCRAPVTTPEALERALDGGDRWSEKSQGGGS